MTAGTIGFGALLLVRHRLRGPEPALAAVESGQARHSGRTVLLITGILVLLVLVIVTARIVGGGSIAPLSLLMPLAGLLWLTSLGLKVLRHPAPSSDAASTEGDRPSRRPPDWKQRPAGVTKGRAASDRHASV
jgi:hypothetical protein